jgi:hypothetical protein
MPFSKHRRKAGGKSVRHPGRSTAPKTEEIQIPDKGWQLIEAIENDPGSALYQRFKHGYAGPFHEKYDFEGPHDSSSLLDIITENAFDATGSGTLLPVSKAALLLEYLVERDDLDAAHANAEAEAALAFLQAEGMVELTGDEIRVPARFWPPV